MRSTKPPMPKLALLLALSIALAGCSKTPVVEIGHPPVADLGVEAKPVMPDEAITDDKAAARYSEALESWGERGWATVARLCRWAKETGASDLDCPPPR